MGLILGAECLPPAYLPDYKTIRMRLIFRSIQIRITTIYIVVQDKLINFWEN